MDRKNNNIELGTIDFGSNGKDEKVFDFTEVKNLNPKDLIKKINEWDDKTLLTAVEYFSSNKEYKDINSIIFEALYKRIEKWDDKILLLNSKNPNIVIRSLAITFLEFKKGKEIKQVLNNDTL